MVLVLHSPNEFFLIVASEQWCHCFRGPDHYK
jgi:hypothetical protein